MKINLLKESGLETGATEVAIVKCLSCGKEVKVKLIRYGSGYIGRCPQCGKLAYNADKKP